MISAWLGPTLRNMLASSVLMASSAATHRTTMIRIGSGSDTVLPPSALGRRSFHERVDRLDVGDAALLSHDHDLCTTLERLAALGARAGHPTRATFAVDQLDGAARADADGEATDRAGHVVVVAAQVGRLAGQQDTHHERKDDGRAGQADDG